MDLCRYVNTDILPKEMFQQAKDAGVDFATLEDAGECIGRLLSDQNITGRCIFLCPRKWGSRGYCDLDLDEFKGEKLQAIAREQMLLGPPENSLFL